MKKTIMIILTMVVCLALAVNACPQGSICSERTKPIIELVTQEDIDHWTALRSVVKCHKLDNGLLYCEDGWVQNHHGYKIISNETIKSWGLSNLKGLVDMSRDWQNKLANISEY